jgi:hypothetical protein
MLFNLNRLYNFTTYAPALFSDAFKQMRVIGIVGYNTAKQHSNVDVLQRQIFPLLPAGTPDRTADYTYLLFESSAGIKSVLAYPWIIENSIVEVESINLSVSVFDIDDTDMNKIRDVLNSMGYKFTMQQMNP